MGAQTMNDRKEAVPFCSNHTQRDEFKAWLKDNAHILKERTIDQQAEIALACGFSRAIVTPWQNSENFKVIGQ
jgi:endogenous inhibitor of DNA gyrase (YacG/DUF329 family)